MDTLDRENDEMVYEVNNEFPFSDLYLENPEPITNGYYFLRLCTFNTPTNSAFMSDKGKCEGVKLSLKRKPIYIQFPKCYIKSGFISNKREKYCDLLYNYKSESKLIEWIEQLETSCKDIIDNKKQLWFQSDLTRNDIDTMMTPVIRMYKSGKNILLRCYIEVNSHNGKHKCLIYDEDENEMDISSIDNTCEIIPLLHIEGIRFSSKTFEFDIKLTQLMATGRGIPIESRVGQVKDNAEVELAQASAVAQQAIAQASAVEAQPSAVAQQASTVEAQQALAVAQASAVAQTVEAQQASAQAIAVEQAIAVAQQPLEQTNEVAAGLLENIEEKEYKDIPKHIYLDTPTTTKEEEDLLEIPLEHLDIKEDGSVGIELKKPNEVYYKIYKAARRKAIKMRQKAIEAYLEAKQIKTKYMLQHLGDSDSDSDFENENEIVMDDSDSDSDSEDGNEKDRD
jgi:hypothetical protein